MLCGREAACTEADKPDMYGQKVYGWGLVTVFPLLALKDFVFRHCLAHLVAQHQPCSQTNCVQA